MFFSQHLLKILSYDDRVSVLSHIEFLLNFTFLNCDNGIKNQHITIRLSNGLSFKRMDIFINMDGLILLHDMEF